MKTDIELAEAAGFELLMDGRISHMAIEKGDCDQEVRALIRLMREELVAVVAAERERCAKLLTQSASLAWSEGVAAEGERIKARLRGMDDAAGGRHNYYAHAALVLFEQA